MGQCSGLLHLEERITERLYLLFLIMLVGIGYRGFFTLHSLGLRFRVVGLRGLILAATEEVFYIHALESQGNYVAFVNDATTKTIAGKRLNIYTFSTLGYSWSAQRVRKVCQNAAGDTSIVSIETSTTFSFASISVGTTKQWEQPGLNLYTSGDTSISLASCLYDGTSVYLLAAKSNENLAYLSTITASTGTI